MSLFNTYLLNISLVNINGWRLMGGAGRARTDDDRIMSSGAMTGSSKVELG
jgi:hypothetical protein